MGWKYFESHVALIQMVSGVEDGKYSFILARID